MIELFASDTPNGKKISIMLEEIEFPYKVTAVDLGKGDQFDPKFTEISPFSKIPVIKDDKESVFGRFDRTFSTSGEASPRVCAQSESSTAR